MSLERRALLKAFGAEIHLTEPEEVMEGAIRKARQIAHERGAFMPQQFQNHANPAVHEETTGAEFCAAIEEEGGGIAAFVAGVGTGGTITGVGRALRKKHASVSIVAVEPESSAVLSGKPPGPSKIQGLAAGFVPEVLDPKVFDRIVTVRDADAWAMKERLAREEGILVGISSGANVTAARLVAQELGPDRRVYTVLADTGERYFSLAEYF
jgi:cysteine synthase A